MSILSEIGSLQLEWTYLSKATGKNVFSEKVAKIIQHLYNLTKPAGLYSNYLDPVSGKWGSKYVSLGAYGDSFYEYLFMMWLWGGKTDKRLKEMFDSALVAVEEHTMKTSKAGLLYFTPFPNGALEQMEHLACFAGGMYAVSAPHAAQPEGSMEVARNITTTCHESYARTAYHLGLDIFNVDPNTPASTGREGHEAYLIRPEVIESYFYLWRLTKEPRYREWGWEVAQAIETYCRTPSA